MLPHRRLGEDSTIKWQTPARSLYLTSGIKTAGLGIQGHSTSVLKWVMASNYPKATRLILPAVSLGC